VFRCNRIFNDALQLYIKYERDKLRMKHVEGLSHHLDRETEENQEL
jgi:hypothetical protein